MRFPTIRRNEPLVADTLASCGINISEPSRTRSLIMTYISFREAQLRAASAEMQAALDEILELLRTRRTREEPWVAASQRLDDAVISWRGALRNIRGVQLGHLLATKGSITYDSDR